MNNPNNAASLKATLQPQADSAPIQANSTLLEDAELALQNLKNQEVHLIKEMEVLFKSQVEYVRQMDQLRGFAPDMVKVDVCTKRLLTLVDSSSALVDDVCGRVKRVDLAKERLEDCLSKVADILDLKKCRQGLSKAMQECNYEEAAMYIKRFLAIDKHQLEKTIAIIQGKQEGLQHHHRHLLPDVNKSHHHQDQEAIDSVYMEIALAELDETRVRLVHLCQDMISRAIQQDDTKNIERFFKLFPMLNEHQEGLTRYAKYLQTKMVDQQVQATIDSNKVNQADKLAALYESIAKLVDQHKPLVETFYGPGHLLVVVAVIQKECDRLSRKILEEFRNTTKLQHVAKMVRAAALQSPMVNFQQAPNNTGGGPAQSINLTPSKLDPREVDSILNQISLIISRSEVYLNFLVQMVKDDLKSEDQACKQSKLLELYNLICIECELNHLVQEVGGIYVMLEQFYLNESSKKAILMDQVDVESTGCPISSMLDDIFFIVKKCINRAISSRSIELFCAVINHCVTLLESMFCQILEEKLKSQQYYSTSLTARYLDRSLQSTTDLEVARAQYFSALNNLDKACDYTQTLRGLLDSDIKKLKPPLLVLENQQQQHHNQKSVSCLNELSGLIGRFSSIANSSLYQLFNAALRNRVRTELKNLMQENPDLRLITLNSPVEMVGLAKDLLTIADKTLQHYLTPENYSKLVVITRDFLASTIKSFK